jgi:hypothetical protein
VFQRGDCYTGGGAAEWAGFAWDEDSWTIPQESALFVCLFLRNRVVRLRERRAGVEGSLVELKSGTVSGAA